MGLEGDWAALKGLQAKIDEARKLKLDDAVAKVIGAAAYKLVADEFKDSHAPDGTAWAPVHRNRMKDRKARARRANSINAWKRLPRGDKPLIDTGRLRASLANHTQGNLVRLALPVVYAAVHNFGFPQRNIKQRQILPSGKLPPHWSSLFEKEALALIKRNLHGKKGERF